MDSSSLNQENSGGVSLAHSLEGSLAPSMMSLGIPHGPDKMSQEVDILANAYEASLFALLSYREFGPIRNELARPNPSWEAVASEYEMYHDVIGELEEGGDLGKIQDKELLAIAEIKPTTAVRFAREKWFNMAMHMGVKPITNTDLGICTPENPGFACSSEDRTTPDIIYAMDDTGFYQSQDGLAAAWVTTRMDPENPGKRVLEVAFRGTEFSDLAAYALHAYPNMSWHYAHFRPLTNAVMEYAAKPENGISRVSASGHSLGGAMVQEFLRDFPEQKTSVPLEGHTFGSPGSVKTGLLLGVAVGLKAFQKVMGVAASLLTTPISALTWEAGMRLDDRFYNFYDISTRLVQRLYAKPVFKKAPHHEPRLHEFHHFADAIPKLGGRGYRRSGKIFQVFNESYESLRDEGASKFSLSKHDMSGYCSIFESALVNRLAGGPDIAADVRVFEFLKNTITALSRPYKLPSIDKTREVYCRPDGQPRVEPHL